MSSLTESAVEDAALVWLEELGYDVLRGPEMAVGEPAAGRSRHLNIVQKYRTLLHDDRETN